jgi:predicted transcriptional regulator
MLATHGQLSATEICNKFHVSPQAISQHLKVLREANFVRVEKRAQQRIYQINPQAMVEVEEWAKQFRLIWSERFETLDQILKVQSELSLKNQMEGNEETHGDN